MLQCEFNLMFALFLLVYTYGLIFKVVIFSLKHGLCQCWSVRVQGVGPCGVSLVCGVSRAVETLVLLTTANQAA